MQLRTVHALRYVTPLREGGSLPAIVEADDDGLYVLKFRGAGQGIKALIAELLGGEIARRIGLKVPELVFVDLDEALGRNEPDYEIRSLIAASAGENLALDYLPGSVTYDPVRARALTPELASAVVWLDAFITNVDRTPRNTNMLVWHRDVWLIDHGAAFFFHHSWSDYQAKARSPFVQIKDHVLLPQATMLREVNAEIVPKLGEAFFRELVQAIPEAWLVEGSPFASAEEHREAYVEYLTERLKASEVFVEEAERARAK